MKDYLLLLKPIARSTKYHLISYLLLAPATVSVAIASWFGFMQFYKAIGFKTAPAPVVTVATMVPMAVPALFYSVCVRKLDRWEEENSGI